jgi:hypothetical protein
MDDNSFTLARADDRALITAVVHRYCYYAREGLYSEPDSSGSVMFALFTPDAAVTLPDGSQVPVQDISSVIRGNEPNFIRHHATTIDIRFNGDRDAAVETYFIAITDVAAPDHWGYWRDRFTKQADGSWLISTRAIVGEGRAPDGWLAGMYPS